MLPIFVHSQSINGSTKTRTIQDPMAGNFTVHPNATFGLNGDSVVSSDLNATSGLNGVCEASYGHPLFYIILTILTEVILLLVGVYLYKIYKLCIGKQAPVLAYVQPQPWGGSVGINMPIENPIVAHPYQPGNLRFQS